MPSRVNGSMIFGVMSGGCRKLDNLRGLMMSPSSRAFALCRQIIHQHFSLNFITSSTWQERQRGRKHRGRKTTNPHQPLFQPTTFPTTNQVHNKLTRLSTSSPPSHFLLVLFHHFLVA